MIISQRAWDEYIAALRKINDAAYQAMKDYIERYGFPTERWQQDAMIDIAEAIVNKYGDASSTLAAEFYDRIGQFAGRTLPPAIPADPATTEEIAKAVVGTAKSGNPDIVSGAVGRLVKMQGVDTTMQNAIRDGAEWAWIPRGDTCAFCIALASRGWQEASKKALKGGHAEHIHANCDCTYAIRFDRSSNVAGYDPDTYREMWYEAEGRNSDKKLNSLRRSLYAENRENILAQKRSAYEKSKELESSAAEEADL
ncbi:MAG: hypothetical protein U0K60_11180 [Parafannyhessea umbonata]|nr:hypothetical protein [Parafannyhessea umbonata]